MNCGTRMASLIILLILTLGWSLIAADFLHTITFNRSDIIFEEIDDFHLITLLGCDLTEEISEPQLPAYLLHLALPIGAHVLDVDIIRKVVY